jgi:hypothetical protein
VRREARRPWAIFSHPFGVKTGLRLRESMAMTTTPTPSRAVVTSVEALSVARADAQAVYHDLDALYRIDIQLMPDGWHVDFEFKDDSANSGGPHYIIDSNSGTIRTKRYEQ